MNTRTMIGILVLPIAGFVLGLAIPERFNPLRAASPGAPQVESPVGVIIPEGRIKYLKEGVDLGYKATQGDLEAALVLFNRYTYTERHYQKAYYWAVLAERLGYDTKFGSLIEMTEGNIKANLYAEVNRSIEPSTPVSPSNELPPP